MKDERGSAKEKVECSSKKKQGMQRPCDGGRERDMFEQQRGGGGPCAQDLVRRRVHGEGGGWKEKGRDQTTQGFKPQQGSFSLLHGPRELLTPLCKPPRRRCFAASRCI